ncbi:hypothetical protein EH228_08820 [Erwinia endophytica]|uniref:hypothetical protein n=1 Tax=Erwinia endophytica TaxID=1563158 RepID=UPI001266005E|nr:hypothetical protein [Erwinia endophytica]KAB8312272.1 hypothetical protein EH228_08820 [Erwinia endophytica]
MKILVTDLITQHLEQREMNVFELHAEINKTRATHIGSLRSRLDYLQSKNILTRRAGEAGPVYTLNKTPTSLGGSPRTRELDSLLAAARRRCNAGEDGV